MFFGIQPPSIYDMTARARSLVPTGGNALLAIVVFTSDYRPGSETVHRKHADLCFSRTGVAPSWHRSTFI